MDWNGSVVKPPAFEDEGALHVGKGRFMLFMSGEKKGEQGSTRKRWVLVAIALVAVIVTIIVTTLLIGHQANQMPYKTKLSLSIGSDFETVIQELELPQTAWTETEKGIYQLNEPCKLSGVSFDLQLTFDEDGRLNGYAYMAEYQAGYKKAAADLYKIGIDLNVKAYQQEAVQQADLGKGALKTQFAQGQPLVLNTTSANAYENVGDDPVGKYLDDLEAAEDWPGRVGDYVVKQAINYYDIHMEYTPETETVLIHITSTVEPEREN